MEFEILITPFLLLITHFLLALFCVPAMRRETTASIDSFGAAQRLLFGTRQQQESFGSQEARKTRFIIAHTHTHT
jgi:hypothetical protein